MKINANYKEVLVLKEKLGAATGAGIHLTASEVRILNQILTAAEGDIFPSWEELKRQEMNVHLLETLDPDSDAWKSVMQEVVEFENKYC